MEKEVKCRREGSEGEGNEKRNYAKEGTLTLIGKGEGLSSLRFHPHSSWSFKGAAYPAPWALSHVLEMGPGNHIRSLGFLLPLTANLHF